MSLADPSPRPGGAALPAGPTPDPAGPPPASTADPGGSRTAAEAGSRVVQATVGTFDPESGAGTVLLDDGRPVEFDGAAFAAGGLRLLRFGQRVRLEYTGGRVARVTIHTLP